MHARTHTHTYARAHTHAHPFEHTHEVDPTLKYGVPSACSRLKPFDITGPWLLPVGAVAVREPFTPSRAGTLDAVVNVQLPVYGGANRTWMN